MNRPARGRLVVFAKQPLPGAVKTRFSPPLSALEAAELYACMLADVLETSAAFARGRDVEAVLAVHPARAVGALAAEAPAPFRAVAQRGATLAARMTWALREAGAAGVGPVLLRGSDSPALSAAALEAAHEALARADVAMVPDPDGGYSLIGVRRPVAGLFDHAMSTASVAADTETVARKMGLSCLTLPPSFDLDGVEDLQTLAEARSGPAAALCRRTLAYLDEQDLWRHLHGSAHHVGSA
jgi:rSAM/selenodomain-associated transferase 1